ncbi:hypothetical protein [Stigmatella hybrida]|uniref:hypothetical protein n=1 Tax=Stigmatella hybrida TaxID=394097 RepID=UPI001CDAA49B|nr:hypothetical protein [Stigmatella hybrida]
MADPISAAVPTEALQLWGAGGFGVLIGWYVYYINRYRKADVQLGDLVTVIGVLGGGAILALFPAKTDLFGAYGVGLFIGFFSYFLVLIILVLISKNFTVDWFLDGRRKKPAADFFIPDTVGSTMTAMGDADNRGGGKGGGVN